MSQQRKSEKRGVADYDPNLFKDIFGPQVEKSECKSQQVPMKRMNRKFAMPKKRAKVENKGPMDNLEELQRTVKEEKGPEGFDCPVCFERLTGPYPEGLQAALKTLETKRNVWREKEKERYEAKVAKEKAEGRIYIEPMLQTQDLGKEDLEAFCFAHRLELVWKPMAKERGYPDPVDFETLSNRIKEHGDQLLAIVRGQKESEYFTRAKQRVQQLGVHQAKGAKEMIHQFEQTMPGYYGMRGMEEMMRVMTDLFLDKLDKDTSDPLRPIEYVQQVLVPECAVCLIQKDMGVDKEKAKEIMVESTDYGKRYSL